MKQHQLDTDESSVINAALVNYLEYCSGRRQQFSEIYDELAQVSLDHRDLPMVRERIEHFTVRQAIANDLILYNNFGVFIAEYDEKEMESII